WWTSSTAGTARARPTAAARNSIGSMSRARSISPVSSPSSTRSTKLRSSKLPEPSRGFAVRGVAAHGLAERGDRGGGVALQQVDVAAEGREVRRRRELFLIELQDRERLVELPGAGQAERRDIQRGLAEVVGRSTVIALAQRAIRASRGIGTRRLGRLLNQLLERHRPADAAMAGLARHLDVA